MNTRIASGFFVGCSILFLFNCIAHAQNSSPYDHAYTYGTKKASRSFASEMLQVGYHEGDTNEVTYHSGDQMTHSCACQSTCGSSCNSCCCGSSCHCDDRVFFELFHKSERSFNGFITPMSNIVFFEDPRTTTELRPIFVQHVIPDTAGGGEVRAIAMQIRAALTDRLSLIATKDGYIFGDHPLIGDGFADVALGLKYNLIADPDRQFLFTTGLTYELASGTPRAMQGIGDGEFNIFMSSGKEFWDCFHWVGAAGIRLPVNTTEEVQNVYISNHIDAEIFEKFYAFTEVNWYHRLKSGDNGVPGIDGNNIFNFGSTDVAGTDMVTQAVGFKFKPNCIDEIGVAFEFPLTQRRDIIKNRLTVDYILRF